MKYMSFSLNIPQINIYVCVCSNGKVRLLQVYDGDGDDEDEAS